MGRKMGKRKKLAFSSNDDEYFGHGFYFFENDYTEALNWAKYTRKIKIDNISIIYVYIESDKVYDLVDTEVYKEYINLLKIIEDRYENEKEKVKLRKPYDCKIINVIIDKYGFEMVRGIYFPRHREGLRFLNKDYTRMRRAHIQLCIREKGIIKDSEVEYFEKE